MRHEREGVTVDMTRFDSYCLTEDEERILLTVCLHASSPVGLALTLKGETSLWRSLNYATPFDLAMSLEKNRDYYDLGAWHRRVCDSTLHLEFDLLEGGVWTLRIADRRQPLQLTPVRDALRTPRRLEATCLTCLESQSLPCESDDLRELFGLKQGEQ